MSSSIRDYSDVPCCCWGCKSRLVGEVFFLLKPDTGAKRTHAVGVQTRLGERLDLLATNAPLNFSYQFLVNNISIFGKVNASKSSRKSWLAAVFWYKLRRISKTSSISSNYSEHRWIRKEFTTLSYSWWETKTCEIKVISIFNEIRGSSLIVVCFSVSRIRKNEEAKSEKKESGSNPSLQRHHRKKNKLLF